MKLKPTVTSLKFEKDLFIIDIKQLRVGNSIKHKWVKIKPKWANSLDFVLLTYATSKGSHIHTKGVEVYNL